MYNSEEIVKIIAPNFHIILEKKESTKKISFSTQ